MYSMFQSRFRMEWKQEGLLCTSPVWATKPYCYPNRWCSSLLWAKQSCLTLKLFSPAIRLSGEHCTRCLHTWNLQYVETGLTAHNWSADEGAEGTKNMGLKVQYRFVKSNPSKDTFLPFKHMFTRSIYWIGLIASLTLASSVLTSAPFWAEVRQRIRQSQTLDAVVDSHLDCLKFREWKTPDAQRRAAKHSGSVLFFSCMVPPFHCQVLLKFLQLCW